MRADRGPDRLRPVRIVRGYTEMTPGSVLIEMGRTRVLCTASFDPEVPRWLRDDGVGWVTAEYSMLPGSSRERVPRTSISGGRVKEIQRLIGRALRAVVDRPAMGQGTVRVDCDVLQADGGTRTAAITGAWVALHDAFTRAVEEGTLAAHPIVDHCAAVSVGMVGGEPLLDLDYEEDAGADVDLNVVMTGRGGLVEVQGTAEGRPFTREQLSALLDLAAHGVDGLVAEQRRVLGT
ncbi:MAG TPA: ribonuclease PH [Acidimicrobiia bacterium]|nr:ribonuclease PH [Acidimicrobiia bacterium]